MLTLTLLDIEDADGIRIGTGTADLASKKERLNSLAEQKKKLIEKLGAI